MHLVTLRPTPSFSQSLASKHSSSQEWVRMSDSSSRKRRGRSSCGSLWATSSAVQSKSWHKCSSGTIRHHQRLQTSIMARTRSLTIQATCGTTWTDGAVNCKTIPIWFQVFSRARRMFWYWWVMTSRAQISMLASSKLTLWLITVTRIRRPTCRLFTRRQQSTSNHLRMRTSHGLLSRITISFHMLESTIYTGQVSLLLGQDSRNRLRTTLLCITLNKSFMPAN